MVDVDHVFFRKGGHRDSPVKVVVHQSLADEEPNRLPHRVARHTHRRRQRHFVQLGSRAEISPENSIFEAGDHLVHGGEPFQAESLGRGLKSHWAAVIPSDPHIDQYFIFPALMLKCRATRANVRRRPTVFRRSTSMARMSVLAATAVFGLLAGDAVLVMTAARPLPQSDPTVKAPVAKTLDAHMSRLDRLGFSGAVLVAKGRDVLLERGYGTIDSTKSGLSQLKASSTSDQSRSSSPRPRS